MREYTFALVGIISLVMWVVIGLKLLKRPVTKPYQFALWMSGWLGVIEFVLVFLREGLEIKSFILGMILLLGTIIIGYPIAYFSYQIFRK